MRIIQLIDSATVGGAEQNTALVALEMARRGHQVCVMSPPGPFVDRFEALANEGVEHQTLPLRGPLTAGRQVLSRRLLEWQPDLVHAHMLRADVLLAMQGRRTPYKRITTIHNMFSLEVPSRLRRTVYRMLGSWAYRRFDAIFPVSEFVAAYLHRYLWVSKKRVRVANGLDIEDVRRRALLCDQLPEAGGRRVILTVGRFDQNKGQELVLDAAAALGRDDLEIWLVGVGDRQAQLEERSARLGLNTRFLGRRDDVPALLSRADAVVQPSRWEALPRVVLEALSLGRAVISTRTGGIPELIRDGETGWLAEVNDVPALSAAMAQALDQPDIAKERGEAGRDLVDQRYTIGSAVDAILGHPRLQIESP